MKEKLFGPDIPGEEGLGQINGGQSLSEDQIRRAAQRRIAVGNVVRILRKQEQFIRRGKYFEGMTSREYRLFCECVAMLIYPEGDRLTDEQIYGMGFDPKVVRSKAVGLRAEVSMQAVFMSNPASCEVRTKRGANPIRFMGDR